MPSWFVITVKPRREFSVRDELDERGISCMVPVEHRIVRPSRHAKRRELQSRPILFGYAFVEAPGQLPWHAIADVPGVRGFIAQDDEPYRLRPADVDRLLAMSSVVAPDEDPERPISPGGDALITSGPFAGQVVKVSDIVGQDAQWVTKMFGSLRTVRIPLSSMVAA